MADDTPSTLVDTVYRRIREDVIGGRLAPGEKLRVEHLSAMYEVGTTPLREALSRLSADWLVDSVGNRGFRVAAMSLAGLEDITEMRVLLENRALEQSMEHGDVTWEGRVAAAHHMMSRAERAFNGADPASTNEWEKRNAEFHAALASACGSPLLLTMRATLYDQHQRYRYRAMRERTLPTRDVAHEHLELFEAAIARDRERASALSAEHIRATARELRTVLARKLT